MSKKTTYTLEELRERAARRRGGDTLTIAAGGKPFSIPAPGFWDDELKEGARKAREKGDVAFARTLLGADRYEEFRSSGGRADDLLLLIDEYQHAQEADLGESTPS